MPLLPSHNLGVVHPQAARALPGPQMHLVYLGCEGMGDAPQLGDLNADVEGGKSDWCCSEEGSPLASVVHWRWIPAEE